MIFPLLLALLNLSLERPADTPAGDVAAIVQKSAETNDQDFSEASKFNYLDTSKVKAGTRTVQVTMLEGSPYRRLVSLNGKPLSPHQAKLEDAKESAARRHRQSESPSERKARIAKYQHGQQSNNQMMSQLTAAFNFTMEGEEVLRGFDVWKLKATPKTGYQPPTRDAEVLTGMQGEMYIDKKTYEWVKVTAEVVRPVSIEGFLAQVQPGTRFEIEKNPVAPGTWQITHFTSHAQARVLHMINHVEQDEETFSDFQPVSEPAEQHR